MQGRTLYSHIHIFSFIIYNYILALMANKYKSAQTVAMWIAKEEEEVLDHFKQ